MQKLLNSIKQKIHQDVPEDFFVDETALIIDGNKYPNLDKASWRFNAAAYRQAAVLIAIVDKPEPSVILTRRPLHMKKHAGQIAFPGGKMEQDDADAKTAAMREAYEEIGLESQYIDILGYLDIYQIGSGFNICPVVAKVSQGFELIGDPNEVDEIFDLPLDFLMSEGNFKIYSKNWNGNIHKFYALEYNDYFIWGATADMLKNFRDKLHI